MKRQIKQFVKNFYVRIRYYHIGRPEKHQRMVLFVIGKGCPQKHPGFVDRLKAIVSVYHIAVENGYPFKLICNDPFPIEDYLEPNEVDWKAGGEISFSLKNTGLFTYIPQKGIPLLKSGIEQHHCYYYEGLNIWKCMGIREWGEAWGEAYHKLFRPGPRLKALLEQSVPKERFTAVHIRFVNTLEDFEEGYGSRLKEAQRKRLIERCLECLKRIRDLENEAVYVFSDSIHFLRIIDGMGYSHLNTDHIGHVSFQAERKVYEKTLIDFYVMSAAERIYSVRGEPLYNSAFPEYAAFVGGKTCRIEQLGETAE